MIQLYILCKEGVAMEYGVGTYVTQLTACLQTEPIQLNVVHLLTGGERFSVEDKKDTRHFHIPMPDVSLLTEEEQAYAGKVCLYFLLPYVKPEEKSVFLFNYLAKACFLEQIRSYWSNARFLYVAHFLEYTERMEADELSFYLAVDRIICLSDETRRFLIDRKNISATKTVRIWNAMADSFRRISPEEKGWFRQKLCIFPDEKILLFVGRVDLFKGIDFLIEAFKIFLKENQNSRLFIVGNGLLDLYTSKCAPVWSKISFTGKLEPHQLQELYLIADLGILPSLHEQCSFVAIEMMMYGIPVIVSAAPGLNEMFEAGYNAVDKVQLPFRYKIEEKGVQNLSSAMHNAFIHPEQLALVGRNARGCYEDMYQLDKWREAYKELLVDIWLD